MIDAASLANVIDVGTRVLNGNDREFFGRVWRTDLSVYRTRLQAVGFHEMQSVLDAGCGVGQWTACLAQLNTAVAAVDYSVERVEAVGRIVRELQLKNVRVTRQSVEELDFPDDTFDGVFCYSVLMFTDPTRSLSELHRVLKPGGRIYICANGLGWYIYNLLAERQRNPSSYYDARQAAVEAISNTLSFFGEGTRTGGQLIIPSSFLRREMERLGFRDVIIGAEGTVALIPGIELRSFYGGLAVGAEGVYEAIGFKA